MWTVEFLGAGIVQCKWVTLNLFCSLALREAEVTCSTKLPDTVHGVSHGALALLVSPTPSHADPGCHPRKSSTCCSTEKRWQKKRVCVVECARVCDPYCCGSRVLMVVSIVSWSCLVPPKHGIETDDSLLMSNIHILWRGFHLFCTLPLHSIIECLCVREYLGFSLLWTTLWVSLSAEAHPYAYAQVQEICLLKTVALI